MRSRARHRPRRRDRAVSDEQQLENIASKVRYVGSPEHKDTPSFAGEIRPRADASICPRELRNRPEDITKWLKDAISAGNIGAPWIGCSA